MTDEPPTTSGDVLFGDARVLRALSHPIRIQILGSLRNYGPATATTLAHRLGLDTGTTSYHVRQLAANGLVVEDDTQGNARDRWWKAAHRSTVFNDLEVARENPELAISYLSSVARINTAQIFRYIDDFARFPKAWQEASSQYDRTMQLSAKQLREMGDELEAVAEKYRELAEQGPARGARRVMVQLYAFPRADQ